MSRYYTESARLLLYTIITLSVLITGAIIFYMLTLLLSEPEGSAFKASEFNPVRETHVNSCRFEKPLYVTDAESMAEWLNTTNKETICLKKKSDGIWVAFEVEEQKNR